MGLPPMEMLAPAPPPVSRVSLLDEVECMLAAVLATDQGTLAPAVAMASGISKRLPLQPSD
jgi:hypothetical protein